MQQQNEPQHMLYKLTQHKESWSGRNNIDKKIDKFLSEGEKSARWEVLSMVQDTDIADTRSTKQNLFKK